jgi:hypothetical protein
MLRRLTLAAASAAAITAASAAVSAAVPATAYAEPVPLNLPLLPPPAHGEDSGDQLTVTVHEAGSGADGTYELRCHPGSGSHPDVKGACGTLDQRTRWGKDPFAPVPPGTMCTMEYGGPATAHVTGTWAGRPVDARFDRADGCQIARWNALAPLLPDAHP